MANDTFLAKGLSRNLELNQTPLRLPNTHSYYQVHLNLGEEHKYTLALDLTESYTWVNSYNCGVGEQRLLSEVVDSNNLDSVEEAKDQSSKSINATEPITSSQKSQTCTDRERIVKIPSVYGDLEGRFFTEEASLASAIVAKNFSMISISNNQVENYFGQNTHLQGVLGLSYQSFNGPEFSFVDSLQTTGSISKKIFALKANTFHIGNYPTEVLQFPQNYHTCNLTMNEGLAEELMDGWICDVTHFVIGETNSFSDAEEIEGRVIFDSMLKNIEAPEVFLGVIKTHYIDLNYEDSNCSLVEEEKTYIVCENIEQPLDLSFIIGGYALVIPGEKVFTKEEITDGSTPRLVFNIAFTKQKHNVWRFGKVLLDEYMVVFDGEKGRVGFYGENKINFYKEWNDWWNTGYSSFTSQEHMKYLVIASICLGLALLFVIVCLIVQSLKKKDDEGEAPLNLNPTESEPQEMNDLPEQ